MSLKELKEKVRKLVIQGRTDAALKAIIQWADDRNKDTLATNTSQILSDLTTFKSEKNLGILSNSQINLKRNTINHRTLNILNDVEDSTETKETTKTPELTNEPPISKGGSTSENIKILMLTSNPGSTTKLNLDKEYATIMGKLQGTQDYFTINREKAVSSSEFKEFTQEMQPDILHFSGHGADGDYAGIVVQDDDKRTDQLIKISGLKSLFKFFKRRFTIRAVVLNACHSAEQAKAISNHVEYVIGTTIDIKDRASNAFSSGFYYQLAEDKNMDIENAFDSGRVEGCLAGAEEEHFVIYKNGELIEV